MKKTHLLLLGLISADLTHATSNQAPDFLDNNNINLRYEQSPIGNTSNNQISAINEQAAGIAAELTNTNAVDASSTIQYSTDHLLTEPTVVTPKIVPEIGSPEIALLLNDEVNPLTWQGTSNRLRSQQAVTRLYAKLNYRPLWIVDGRVTPFAASLIQSTLKANEHALRPTVYHTTVTANLKAGDEVSQPARLDVLLTDAFVTYKEHLTNGIMDPKLQFRTWNTDPEVVDFVSLYLNAKRRQDAAIAFNSNNVDYQILQQAYANEIAMQNSEAFPAVPSVSMRPGDSGEQIAILRQRLGLDNSTDLYDEELKNAVSTFQRLNGLSADGIAGRSTIRRMNKKSPNHLKKLMVNLERYRWAYTPKGINYIWANIPGYVMGVRSGRDWLFKSKTVVGKRKRPTPVFSDTLEKVVLAPYWNVPSTIFRKDKLPKLRRNPNAFGSNMQVINSRTGKVVSAASVNWAKGGAGYRLRQKPGARNALGRVKFLFPNRHAIYMHDTPSRHLFKRKKRAYSSGCVRLERAEDFAVFLLQNKGYDKKRVRRESRRSREKWISLTGDQQYPVFINYYTAWVDQNQQLRYSPDIYGYDNKMYNLYQTALNNL